MTDIEQKEAKALIFKHAESDVVKNTVSIIKKITGCSIDEDDEELQLNCFYAILDAAKEAEKQA